MRHLMVQAPGEQTVRHFIGDELRATIPVDSEAEYRKSFAETNGAELPATKEVAPVMTAQGGADANALADMAAQIAALTKLVKGKK